MDGELILLRSEIEELQRIVEKGSASHCLFGLCTLRFPLLDHLVEHLERFGNIPFTDAKPFEHFNVLI